MTKVYRHPYNRSMQPSPLERPTMPQWLQKGLPAHLASGKNGHSFRYWRRMYWATPPWLTDAHVAQMKAKKETCPDDCQLDHEVPLSSPIVCGLNVPWNIVVRPKKENQHKSNNWWPDMPMDLTDLFDPHRHTAFELVSPAPAKKRRVSYISDRKPLTSYISDVPVQAALDLAFVS